MCFYSSNNKHRWVQHTVRLHKHDPNFIVFCSVGECSYSTKSWGAVRVHVSRKHSYNDEAQVQIENDENFEMQEYDDQNEQSTTKQISMCNAAFTLALEGEHKLSQRAINDVVSSTAVLVEDHISMFKVKEQLRARGLPDDFLDTIPSEHLLDEFDSNYKRETFYEKNLSLVNPQPVKVSSSFFTVNGHLIQKERYGYIIPFADSLAHLLELSEVQYYVNNNHRSEN